MEQSLELQQWHTQDFVKNDKLNQTYIGWADRVNETLSANESRQSIMGNKLFDGVVEVWDGVPSSEAHQLEIMTVTSNISFCEDMCIPIQDSLTYNNDKPWFTAKLRQLCQAKQKMLTGRVIKSCINWSNTHWKRISE